MKVPFLLSGIILLFLLGGCQAPPKQIYIEDPDETQRTPSGRTPESQTIYTTVSEQRGIASYYYGRWIGRKTANGEIYRASDITAAHKTLPFNTMVRVTNLRNGKSVIVRINNRGPYVRGRIIDLSLEAARRIQMTQAGIVPVKVEVLRKVPVIERPTLRRPSPTPTPVPPPSPTPRPTRTPRVTPPPTPAADTATTAPAEGETAPQRSSTQRAAASNVRGRAR